MATDLWGEGQSDALDHIEYARWADLVVVAPATANIMAKAAHGIADDIVSTLLLAFPGPVLMAPAMNDNMWRHPATQANREILAGVASTSWVRAVGWLACGTVDEGRMAEPEEILAAVQDSWPDRLAARGAAFSRRRAGPGFWAGKKVVDHRRAHPRTHRPGALRGQPFHRRHGLRPGRRRVSGGRRGDPDHRPGGPAPPRGLAGYRAGGIRPTRWPAPWPRSLDGGADWLIMAAAVADFKPADPAAGKLKKDDLGDGWSLDLIRNPDILGEVVPAPRPDGLKVVGFALETDDVVEPGPGQARGQGHGLHPGQRSHRRRLRVSATGNHQVTLLGARRCDLGERVAAQGPAGRGDSGASWRPRKPRSYESAESESDPMTADRDDRRANILDDFLTWVRQNESAGMQWFLDEAGARAWSRRPSLSPTARLRQRPRAEPDDPFRRRMPGFRGPRPWP